MERSTSLITHHMNETAVDLKFISASLSPDGVGGVIRGWGGFGDLRSVDGSDGDRDRGRIFQLAWHDDGVWDVWGASRWLVASGTGRQESRGV